MGSNMDGSTCSTDCSIRTVIFWKDSAKHDYDKPVLIALQSPNGSASNPSDQNSVNWKGDLAELIIYNDPFLCLQRDK